MTDDIEVVDRASFHSRLLISSKGDTPEVRDQIIRQFRDEIPEAQVEEIYNGVRESMGLKEKREVILSPGLKEVLTGEPASEEYLRDYDEAIAQAEERRKTEAVILPRCKECREDDSGNSDRLVIRYGENLRYCHPFKKWLVWNGKIWERDEVGKIIQLCKDTALKIHAEVDIAKDGTLRGKFASKSNNGRAIRDMEFLARSSLPVLPEDLDARPDLINMQNGTLLFKNFSFVKHCREDYLTRIMGCEFNPAAECPQWMDHLRLVFGDDEEFIQDFQMICGYSLLHDNPEQVMFILYGAGKNGKSVTLEVLRSVWGDDGGYATNVSPDTLMVKKNEAPRGDIVRLIGSRLITSSEGEHGGKLAEGLIKQLTGADKLTGRALYENDFEFRVTGKIWLATNHLPVIKGTDNAIWRRIWAIPFNITIPDDRRDPNITGKLIGEASGIFNWCLEGLKRYYLNGEKLLQPDRVAKAVQEYRTDSDIIKMFIDDRCILEPGNKKLKVSRSVLYDAYIEWCRQNGEDPITTRTFSTRLKERGVHEGPKLFNEGRTWSGIGLS